MSPTTKPKQEGPVQTELGITYSVSVKANTAKYEDASAFISRTEKYDVSALAPEEIDEFFDVRYKEINDQLSALITVEYKTMHGIED